MMANRKWIYYFSDPAQFSDADESRRILGGKGYSLKSMTLAELAVPPGFTIETSCSLKYLENKSIWSEGLESELRENIARLEKETGRQLGAGENPLLVSVRSGAPVSMPGMMDTILNCGLHAGLYEATGSNDAFWKVYAQFVTSFSRSVHNITESDFVKNDAVPLEEVKSQADIDKYISIYGSLTGSDFPVDPWTALLESINAVFNSWNSERAVSYRKRNGITENTGTAVNIQMMFSSAVSGVVFTRSPSDPESDNMIIESSFGLGESVVSGDADPDRFILNRTDLSIIETYVGKKHIEFSALGTSLLPNDDGPCMSEDQLRELGKLALKVEEYFGYPLDIEFGLNEEKFALLQSRRIKGLELISETATAGEEERLRLKTLANGKKCVWVSHNLSETLKHPTPLTWDIVRYFMSGAGGMGEMYRQLGYSVSKSEGEEFLDLICGNIYADPDKIVSMLWRGLPVSCDLETLGTDATYLDNPPVLLAPEKADPLLLLRLPSIVWGSIASSMKIKKLKHTAKNSFENDLLPDFLDYVKKERGRDLKAMTANELRDLLLSRRRCVLCDFGAATLVPGFLGALNMKHLTSLLQRLLGKSEGEAMTQILIGETNSISSQQSLLLGRIAAGEADMNDFIEQFGHRTSDEMELSIPRWREDHSSLTSLLNNTSQDTSDLSLNNHKKILRQAEEELPQKLEATGSASFLEEILGLIKETKSLLPYRENGKHYLMMGYELIRNVALELGNRLDVNEDVFYLHWSELMVESCDNINLKDVIEKRKLRHKAFKAIYLPQLIDSEDLDAIGRSPALDDDHMMKATPVSPGSVRAQAKILFEPQDIGSQEDFILVCPSTDPGWTPLLTRASGLIVEKGGVLSHGALIARELGLPAVVLPNATRIIKNSSTVLIDGTSGAVEIIEEPKKQ